ncbi:DUF6492 family protein [Actinomycetota bacterium]|nr:DUF6492 family protein [Actinomycetota bacterium]
MLCKSYSGDFEYAQRMVKSFHQFNSDAIQLFLVVPEPDLELFFPLSGDSVTLLSEQLLVGHLVDHEVHGMRPGYINQEIVKLSFWELGLAQNYFCVDSDAEFIRPFGVSDFMFDSDTPYSVLVQDLELAVEPEYYNQYWVSREAELRSIAELVGVDSRVVLTCHGHTVFSRTVLESFVNDFLAPRDWTYVDALEFSPYEFTWYNMWLQKSGVIEIHPREPWIKVFHNQSQHMEYLLRGIGLSDIARGYLGVVVNSNYSRGLGVVNAESSQSDSIATYLSYPQLAKTFVRKMKSTWNQGAKRFKWNPPQRM